MICVGAKAIPAPADLLLLGTVWCTPGGLKEPRPRQPKAAGTTADMGGDLFGGVAFAPDCLDGWVKFEITWGVLVVILWKD